MEKPKFSRLRDIGPTSFNISYINPNIKFPFRVENLPLFLDPEGNVKLETHPNHHRVCWYPEVAIGDKLGNIFFAVSIKGVGYLYPQTYESRKDNYTGKQGDKITLHSSKEYNWGYNVLGLFDKRNLSSLIEDSRELVEAGIRCEVIAAAYDLKKVLIDGNPKSLDELREHLKQEALKIGLSKRQIEDIKSFKPSQVIRLSREVTRIKDFCQANRKEQIMLLEKTFKKLNLENELKGNPQRYNTQDSNSIKKYLEEYFKQAAKNLAILHNRGKIMCFLNSGNMTLSLAEIVDLDSIISLIGKRLTISPLITNDPKREIPRGYIKDARDEIYALGIMFLNSFQKITMISRDDRERLHRIFIESYAKSLEQFRLKKLRISTNNLIKMVEELSGKMISNGQSVPPIKVEIA